MLWALRWVRQLRNYFGATLENCSPIEMREWQLLKVHVPTSWLYFLYLVLTFSNALVMIRKALACLTNSAPAVGHQNSSFMLGLCHYFSAITTLFLWVGCAIISVPKPLFFMSGLCHYFSPILTSFPFDIFKFYNMFRNHFRNDIKKFVSNPKHPVSPTYNVGHCSVQSKQSEPQQNTIKLAEGSYDTALNTCQTRHYTIINENGYHRFILGLA